VCEFGMERERKRERERERERERIHFGEVDAKNLL
jgi:hypothetical protein